MNVVLFRYFISFLDVTIALLALSAVNKSIKKKDSYSLILFLVMVFAYVASAVMLWTEI